MEQIEHYFEAAKILKAQETLVAFSISDYPYLKKRDKEKMHRQIYKEAFPDNKPRSLTIEDLKKIHGMGGA